MSAPHDTYTGELSGKRKGTPLYYPEPHPEDGPVEIGDVGYIKHGAFYRLFNVARFPDDPAQRFGVPDDFERLDMGAIRTFKGALQPGPIHSKTVCTLEADIGTQCGILPAEASFHFKCTSNRGAILMLETEMSREEAVQTARFERYLRRHCLSFHAFAKSLDITLGFGDLMLVTECSKTAAWSSAVYADSDKEFGLGFSVGRPFLPSSVGFSAAAGVQRIGSVDRRRSQQRALPESPPLPNDHTVFLKAFRLGTRQAYVQSTVSLFMKARDSVFGERRGDARSKKARRSSASGGSTPPSPSPPSSPRVASYSDIVVMQPDDSDYHPSIPLLGLAMEASDSDFAIIHDDVWCSARVDSEESQIIKEYAKFHFDNDADFNVSSMPEACGVVDERTIQRLSMLGELEHATMNDSDDSHARCGSEVKNQQGLRESLWTLSGSASVPGGWNPYEDEDVPSDYSSEDELVDQLRRPFPLLVDDTSKQIHRPLGMEPRDGLHEEATQSIVHDSGSGQDNMSEGQGFGAGAIRGGFLSVAARRRAALPEPDIGGLSVAMRRPWALMEEDITIRTGADQKQRIPWPHGPSGAGTYAIMRTVAEHLAERDVFDDPFIVDQHTSRGFLSVQSYANRMRQIRSLREKVRYFRSQDPEVGHSFSAEHAPSHSPHVIRSSPPTPSTHTYRNVKQLPKAVWDAFRSSPGEKNNILSQVIKAFDAAQTPGEGNDPPSVCITSGSASNVEFVLAATEGSLGSYPVFIFTPLAVDALTEDYIRPTISALASALQNAMPSHRVYSVLATEPVARVFAEEWTRLTGIGKHADEPYYAAKLSYCATQNPKTQSPGIDLDSLGNRPRILIPEDPDLSTVAELCFNFAEESFPFRMDRFAAEEEAVLLVETEQVWVHEARDSGPGRRKEIAFIVAFTRDSDNIASITKVYTNPRWRKPECAERLVRGVCEQLLSALGREERIAVYTPQDDWTITNTYRHVGLGQPAERAEGVEGVDSTVGIGLDDAAVEPNVETHS